jgi:hypothetical protein
MLSGGFLDGVDHARKGRAASESRRRQQGNELSWVLFENLIAVLDMDSH